MFGLVDEEGCDKIVLDFENVEYLLSVVFGKFIIMDKKVKVVKGKLWLCSIKLEIYEVFVIIKFNKLFDMKSDCEEVFVNF